MITGFTDHAIKLSKLWNRIIKKGKKLLNSDW